MTSHVDSGPAAAGPVEASPMAVNESEPVRSGGTRGRTLLQRGLEIIVSLGCLFLALRTAHPADLWAALRHANFAWVAAFVATMMVVLALKTWRWQLLFYPEYRLPFGPLFSILAVSYMVSNVLPGRAGELARVILVPAEQPVSAARTVSTIVVERLLDVLCVIVLLILLLPFVHLPAEMLRSAQVLGILALAAAVALVLLSFWKARLLAWAHALLRHVPLLDRPAVYAAAEHLIDGFGMLRSPLGLVVVALALASWLGVVVLAWTAAQAFQIAVPITAIVFAVVLTSLSQSLPSTPGYIGVFQLAARMALVPLGVAPALAEIYAFAWWGINYLTLTITGMVAMWVHGISFAQILGRGKPKAVAEA